MSLSASSLLDVISNLEKEFFNKNNQEKYENYIGCEKLKDEFLKLHLPRASEVLNIAAGPGILSAMLQLNGYNSIDAIDDDETDLKKLLTSNLYRNTICKSISGLNSTGLREDVYDVVVIAGGFRPGKISPVALSEILRLVKPEGHILWTLRSDYHNQNSDIGLIDENLNDLEKARKCSIMKQGEKFADPHSNLEGLFYLIKRHDGEDFQPNLSDATVPNIVIDAFIEPKDSEINKEELLQTETEDKPIPVDQFTGHIKLCQAFLKLRLKRNVEILDVSSHMSQPGLVGIELSHNGYDHVDGLDHNLESLKSVKAMKLYRNSILGNVAELGSIPVNDESYDVILMGGGFGLGQILPTAFHELIRVLRPGGYIMWTMRDGEAEAQDPDFALFDVKVEDLVHERKWELIVGPVSFENFDNKSAGKFYMLRKCHREVFALGSPRHSPTSSPRLSRRRPSLRS